MPDAILFQCPKCGAPSGVSAVQGDRCPRCGVEFTRFGANEEQSARDFHGAITGEKYLVALPDGGWVSVHR